ncbi:hypothetical protein C8R47DRAFT_1265283 [Mycena vitilis]|nr:hypothetical protein C8R47DRAFT_1265283 [Mycena vitilis]
MSPPTRRPTPQPVRKERPTCPNRAPTLPNADSRPTTPPTDTRAKDQRPTARADDAGSGTTANDAACPISQTATDGSAHLPDPTFSTLCPAPSTGSPGISNYALHHEVRPASRDTVTQKARDVAFRANPPKHSANPKPAIRHTDAIPHQQQHRCPYHSVRREKRGSGPTTEVGSDSEVAPRPSKRRREVSPESGLPALPPREVLPTRTSEMRLLVEQLERDNVRMWQRMAASEDRTRVLYELLAMLRGVGGREGELAAIDDMLRRAMVEFPLGRPLPARVRYVLEGSESEEEPEEKPEESEESEEEKSDPKGKRKARLRPEERRREKPKAARGSGRRRKFSGVQVPTRREARLAEIANDLFPPPLNTEGLIRFPPKEEDDPMGRAEIGGAEGGEVVSSEVAKEASPVAGTSGTRKTPTPEPTNEDARRSPSEVREEAPRMEVDGGAPTESEVTAGDVEMGGVAPEIGGGAPTASEVEKGGDEGETEPFGPGGDVVV